MILTKEQCHLYTRGLDRYVPDDLLDTIEALESQLAQVQADEVAAVEAAYRKAAEVATGFEYKLATCTQFGETTVHENPYADVHKVAAAILELIPGNALIEHDVVIHKQGFDAGFEGAECAAFERERKWIAERAEHDARLLEPMEKLAEKWNQQITGSVSILEDVQRVTTRARKYCAGELEVVLQQARGTNAAKEG